MAEQLPRGLLADPAMQRAMLLPVARRTYTDPGDDITEEQALELAMPGLLYDPMMGMAQTGAMLMGDMPADPNVMTQTMLDAPLVGGLLGAATGAAPKGALLGANVFHGGPHRFAPEPDFPHGRPRLDKVGTGEGAQAYGYGFYSAEAPGVAKSYADALGGKVLEASDGSILHSSDIPLDMMYASMEMGAAKTIDEAISNLSKSGKFGDEVKYLSELRDKGYQMKPGTLYKLDIPDADVAKYLDYDKPLSEQPKSIQAALSELLEGNATKRLAEAEKALRGLNEGDAGWSAASSEYRRARQNVQNMVGPGHPTADVAGLMKTLAAEYGSPQAASEALRKAGIPGLKYFDADSRGVPKADRTRNYVTWDQDVLNRSKMLERDGVTLGANKGPTAALPGLLDDVGKGSRAASRLPEHLVPLTDDKLEFALPSTKYLVKKIREKAPDAELGLSLSENQVGKSNYLTLTHPNKRNIEIRLSDHATGPNRAFESAAQFSDYVPEGGKPKFGQISRESFDKRINEVLSYYDDGIELGANKAPTAALPGLLDDTASRMQRARDMGFDVDAYHGTRGDFTQFEKGDLGFHFGSPEQATNRLRQTEKVFGSEGANIIPAKINVNKSLELPDLGQWNDPAVVAAGIIERGGAFGRKYGNELQEVQQEADDLKRQFEDGDAWVESMEAENLLDEIQGIIKRDGYDSVKYLNEIENKMGDRGGFTIEGQKKYNALNKEFHELNKKIAQRDTPAPELGASEVEISRWLNRKPTEPTAAESKRLEEIARAKEEVEKTGTHSPYSYIVFDPKNIRSRFAKFDPAKADSADLLAANPATAALPGLLQDRRRTPRNQNSFPMRSLLGQRVYTATMPDGSI